MTIQPEKEVRFAVVMYGGVSLAIYINGVTQELLSLVRATARSEQNNGTDYHLPQVSGVEAVYRKLGETAKARFVVDILSGTSAGGINAVYLAKALANDQQIGQLKKMWLDEGDIASFLNDKTSLSGLSGVSLSSPITSLLNSQRMYYQLLYALQQMQEPTIPLPEGARSPYVEELDLFITATDLRGLPLPVYRSRQAVARELRFRNVFHFHYATPKAAGGSFVNDFVASNDPFLAFAARCTSSFPFVFEPMRLKDVEALLGRGQFKNYVYQPDQWTSFSKGYTSENFPAKAFGDGGYLDNKPFSYATATLNRRRRDLPIDRKLVYVEPAPEPVNDPKEEPDPPDAIANVWLALLTLPRSETIREDLQFVTERNDLLRGVGQIVAGIENINVLQGISLDKWQSTRDWRKQFLNELVDTYGAGYLVYHQLRVEEILQDLTDMIARTLGWEEDCAQARDLSTLLHAWRQAYYKTSKEEKDPNTAIRRKSENDILFRLDANWRMRRLKYLLGLIDLLANDLGDGKFAGLNPRVASLLKHSHVEWPVNETNVEDYRSALLWAKEKLSQAHIDLRGHGRAMRARNLHMHPDGSDADLDEYVRHLQGLKTFFESQSRYGFSPTQIEELSQLSAAQAASMPLTPDKQAYYSESLQRLEELTVALSSRKAKPAHKGMLRAALSDTSKKAQIALDPNTQSQDEDNLSAGAKLALARVRQCLNYYHDRFEYFDMLTYPVTYGTNVGESDEVEIVRISPEDGVNIVPSAKSHTKLAGTRLANFGAFFNREWRENDMLWGRLDGAECLIRAVLPDERDEAVRNELINEAQSVILEEFQLSRDKPMVLEALFGSEKFSKEQLQKAKASLMGDRTQLIENFKAGYQVDPEYPPEPTLKAIARASSVMGQVLGGLTQTYPLLSQPTGIFSRFGRLFFGLVSIALPQSLPNLIFKTVIGFIYLVEFLVIALGWFLVQVDTPNRGFDFNTLGTQIASLGARVVVVTLAAHLAIMVLGRVMSRKWDLSKLAWVRMSLNAVLVLLAIGVLIVLYSGFVYLGAMPAPQGWLARSLDLLKHFLGP
jgi:patatin-related protein